MQQSFAGSANGLTGWNTKLKVQVHRSTFSSGSHTIQVSSPWPGQAAWKQGAPSWSHEERHQNLVSQSDRRAGCESVADTHFVWARAVETHFGDWRQKYTAENRSPRQPDEAFTANVRGWKTTMLGLTWGIRATKWFQQIGFVCMLNDVMHLVENKGPESPTCEVFSRNERSGREELREGVGWVSELGWVELSWVEWSGVEWSGVKWSEVKWSEASWVSEWLSEWSARPPSSIAHSEKRRKEKQKESRREGSQEGRK